MKEYHFHNSDARDQCGNLTHSPPEGVAEPQAGTPPGEPEQSTSMASSVTRHATRHALISPAAEFRYLICGIDSLDLGLFVQWDENWPESVINLQEKKDAAQGNNGILDKTCADREFLHLPSGKAPNYRFHLKFAEYELYLAISEVFGQSPNAYLSIHAESIWKDGIHKILELIALDLLNFGGNIIKVKVSRVDLCADFKVSPGLTLPFLQQHKVTKSSEVRSIIKSEVLETCYFASPKSPVQLRIYDKGKEVLSMGTKLWFAEHWGTDDFDNIVRVEYQLRRTFLRQVGIDSLDDLFQKCGGIWFYLTEEWFSLRMPDKVQQNRREIHPWWQEVQNCAGRFGFVLEVQRQYSSDFMASADWFFKHIAGCMPAIAARMKTDDIIKALHETAERVFELWRNRDFSGKCRIEAIKLGYRGKLGGNDDEK